MNPLIVSNDVLSSSIFVSFVALKINAVIMTEIADGIYKLDKI